MYYKLVAGQEFFELNPGVRAVPIFKDLTDMQMKYICLLCDLSHDNPVRTLEGKNKREKAAMLAGYKMEVGGKRLEKNGREIIGGLNKNIENGIIEFKRLHFDEKTDMKESLGAQIAEIRDFMKSNKGNDPKKMKAAIDLGIRLPELVEAKLKIERLLEVVTTQKPELDLTYTTADIETTEDFGPKDEKEDHQLSTLDKFMQRR